MVKTREFLLMSLVVLAAVMSVSCHDDDDRLCRQKAEEMQILEDLKVEKFTIVHSDQSDCHAVCSKISIHPGFQFNGTPSCCCGDVQEEKVIQDLQCRAQAKKLGKAKFIEGVKKFTMIRHPSYRYFCRFICKDYKAKDGFEILELESCCCPDIPEQELTDVHVKETDISYNSPSTSSGLRRRGVRQ